MSLLSNGQNHICKNKKYYFNSDYDVWLKFIVLKAIFNKIISMTVCKKNNYEKHTKVNIMTSTTTTVFGFYHPNKNLLPSIAIIVFIYN